MATLANVLLAPVDTAVRIGQYDRLILVDNANTTLVTTLLLWTMLTQH